jgi:nanoRNase/pAp phosphatase (c-di-AMP/oligoRNAs hydrolase)
MTPIPNPSDVDLVLYHKNCPDGFGAAWAAWRLVGHQAEYIPVNYTDEEVPDVVGRHVAIVDFSYPRDVLERLMEESASLIVLDHHKTAEEQLEGFPNAIFNLERSGAFLAWEWFHPDTNVPHLILYIQDRDLWQWNLWHSREFSAGLFLVPREFEEFDHIYERQDGSGVTELIHRGEAVIQYQNKIHEIMAGHAILVEVGGTKVWAVNAPALFRSDVGNILAKKDEVGIALIWWFSGKKNQIGCSLRSRPGISVLPLAESFGGGGHAQAAGFRWKGTFEELATFIEDDDTETGP